MDLSDPKDLASLLEAFLLASGKPLSLERLGELFEEHERPSSAQLKKALEVLDKSCKGRAFELKEVASGYRLQVRQRFSPWVGRLWEERPQRYSRALLETLALIAYRQPITRGEIEDIRGVAVNSQIVKTLQEREWIRVVGHRDVPGRPAMFATTRQFLDHFNLKNLDELPPLAVLREMEPELRPLLDEYRERPNVHLASGMAQDPRLGACAIQDLDDRGELTRLFGEIFTRVLEAGNGQLDLLIVSEFDYNAGGMGAGGGPATGSRFCAMPPGAPAPRFAAA